VRDLKTIITIGIASVAFSGVLAALYLQQGQNGNPAACNAVKDTPAKLAPAAIGEVAAFQPQKTPVALPNLTFKAADGSLRTMADFKDKTVLLNLWATWCAPCRKEMPALDALQADFGSPQFEVVAVNIDMRNLDKPREWLSDNKVRKLAYYADPEAKIFQELKRVGQAVGMPTTLLIGKGGCILGALHGAAEWASPDARRLISAALSH
jgi:thiol-disulfide isomerase/thioredoxin